MRGVDFAAEWGAQVWDRYPSFRTRDARAGIQTAASVAPGFRAHRNAMTRKDVIGDVARNKGLHMFRVTLACENVPMSAGVAAASEIQQEFAEHRAHHKNVVCAFTNGELVLTAENDFDPKGLALIDEFSDCISAHIAELFDGEIRVVEAITL